MIAFCYKKHKLFIILFGGYYYLLYFCNRKQENKVKMKAKRPFYITKCHY